MKKRNKDFIKENEYVIENGEKRREKTDFMGYEEEKDFMGYEI